MKIIYVNKTVCKTLFFLLLVTKALTVYTRYGEMTIDFFMPEEKIIVKSLRFSEKQTLRVVSGIEDTSNLYPYVVALGMKPADLSPVHEHVFKNTPYSEFLRTCTGSLISEQWVLTAAHCCVGIVAKPAKIRYGNLTVLPNDTLATYSSILKIFNHPNYILSLDVVSVLRNDIALLLVDRVRLSVYGRVSAVDYRTLVGLPVKYVGLGRTNTSNELENEVQNRLYGEAAVAPCPRVVKLLNNPMLCLARKCSKLGQYTDSGDSGGPLLQAGDIVGVLTGTIDHSSLLRPVIVYTVVSPYLDWIGKTMHSATIISEN